MNKLSTVYIIDDDEGVRKSLLWLLESVDLRAKCFPSASSFLAYYSDECFGCIVLDIRMPAISGLDLQQILIDKNSSIPIIFVTAHADVPIAIKALKRGAFDFIEKPYSDQLLLERIQEALHFENENQVEYEKQLHVSEKIQALTTREHQVFMMILNGNQNKEIARLLNLSIKTIEVHRANVLKKLDVTTTPALFRLASSAKLI